MKHKSTRYRALTPEFRAFLTETGLWPLGKHYTDHMRTHHGGSSGKALTDLRAGSAVTEKAALGLLTYMLTSDHAVEGTRDKILGFVETKGGTLGAHADDLLPLITGEPRDSAGPAEDEADYLRRGSRGAVDLLMGPRRAITNRSRAIEPGEIDDAVGWLHVFIAASLSGKKARQTMTRNAARPVAEAHMGIGHDGYAARLAGWRSEIPLTVRVALGRRLPVGFSAVLPITEEAYELVRSGQRASYDTPATDLRQTSRHLLIEAVAERVATERVDPTNPTLPLLATLLTQIAHLSGVRDRSDDTSIRLLSFAGTEESRLRLEDQGFRPTGAVMPRAGVAVLERVFTVGAGAGLDAVTVMILQWIAKRPIDG